MLAAVALADCDDQLLADVAREVEVDVGHRGELAVDEAAEREPGPHRVDVREAGQVADDRADRAAAPAARRQDVARHRAAAHLEGALARQLEHLPVEQEEPGEAELVDQLQLVVEPLARAALVAVRVAVALLEGAVADAGEVANRGLAGVREVGIPVAEVLGQVELEPFRELGRAGHRVAVMREALLPLRGLEEHALVVAAALWLAAVERGAAADRDEHVLERGAAWMVRMRVAGGDGPDAERLGEVAQRGEPAGVAPLIRALQLHEEPFAPERPCQRRRTVRASRREPVPRAAGEADEALVQLGHQRGGERRWRGLRRPGAGVRVRGAQQPAEIRVAALRLDEQRHVRAVRQRHLGARDRPHAEHLRRMRELERAVDPVVVGQRERLVAELGRARRQLLRQRGTVQERIR